MKYARDLFGEPPADARGTDRKLVDYLEVQGVMVTLEHTYANCNQNSVQARIPNCQENWGHAVPLSRPFAEITVAQFDRDVLAHFNAHDDPLVPCPNCGTMTWNRKHYPSEYRDERCSKCWFEAFNARQQKAHERELAALAKRDRKQHAAGMRLRYSCWVHPSRGDDFQLDVYTNATDPQIGAKLKRKYRAVLVEVAKPVQLQGT